jgi:uncharacterized membrane protein
MEHVGKSAVSRKFVILKKVNAVLLLWLGARCVNLFLHHVAQHAAIHTEANLLLKNLCDTDQRNKISGALIDCDHARRLMATKSFALLYALEHTMYDVVVGTFRTATREVASLAKLLGLVTCCAFTAAFMVHSAWMRYMQLKHESKLYNESMVSAIMQNFRKEHLLSQQPAPHKLLGKGWDNDDDPAEFKFD